MESVALAVEEPVESLGPVAAGDDHRGGAELVQRLGERPPVGIVGVRHAEQRAGLVEVRRDDCGERKELLDEDARRVVFEQLRAGGGHHDRVDHERHVVRGRAKSATASMMRALKSMPVLAASTPMSSKTASSCARAKAGGASCTAVTEVVFWAVSATIALMPWQPRAANAFRSAWMPAPPPESEVAIVRHRGTTEHQR